MHSTRGHAATRVPRVWRNHKDLPGRQAMRDALNDQLQFAFEDADDLLVRMLVLGKRRTLIDIHPRMRHAIAMDQTGTEPWK